MQQEGLNQTNSVLHISKNAGSCWKQHEASTSTTSQVICGPGGRRTMWSVHGDVVERPTTFHRRVQPELSETRDSITLGGVPDVHQRTGRIKHNSSHTHISLHTSKQTASRTYPRLHLYRKKNICIHARAYTPTRCCTHACAPKQKYKCVDGQSNKNMLMSTRFYAHVYSNAQALV